MKNQIKQLVKDVSSVLVYHKSAGIDTYPASDELGRLLSGHGWRQKAVSPHPVRNERSTVAIGEKKPGMVRNVRTAKATVASESDLQELENEIVRCQACSLCQSRTVPVPGAGSGKCRLLIVGDWLIADQANRLPDGCQFGIEQDRMLHRMLEAIKMDRREVFVTNVIKCGIPSSKQPHAIHVNTCVSFLRKQISLLRPQLILAMGLIAARTLVDRPESLSRIRGRIHSYQGHGKIDIPLVATYHPTFLLQNAGMKKATWADLQLAAKHLARISAG